MVEVRELVQIEADVTGRFTVEEINQGRCTYTENVPLTHCQKAF
jgi:hypothetical protein